MFKFRFFLFYLTLLIPLHGYTVLWQDHHGKIASVIYLGKYNIKEPYALEKDNIYYITEKGSIDFSDIESTFLNGTCYSILTPCWSQDDMIMRMSAELTGYLINDGSIYHTMEYYDFELYKTIDDINVYQIKDEIDEFLIFLVSIASFNDINDPVDVEYEVLDFTKPIEFSNYRIKSSMPKSEYVLFAMPLKYM